MKSMNTRAINKKGVTVDWYHMIGMIIDDLESERFPELFVDKIERLIAFDLATIFIYRGRSRPIPVYNNLPSAGAQKAMGAYVESSYVLNPLYQSYLNGMRSGVYRMRDLAPDAFFESEYYKSYKTLQRTSEEIGYLTEGWPEDLEEVDIIFTLENGEAAELSIYRYVTSRGFSDDELTDITTVEPALGAIFRKYWAATGGAKAPPLDSRVDDAFASFGEKLLTDRECEVVRMILHGHSSESICFNLGISLGTVKTHRKHIYGKLDISSQSELLALFLRSLQTD